MKQERLTRWNGKKWILPQGRTRDGESCWRIIADRLAEYENRDRTAEWVNDENDIPRCSGCGYVPQIDTAIDDYFYSRYCPNCGARCYI